MLESHFLEQKQRGVSALSSTLVRNTRTCLGILVTDQKDALQQPG